MKYCYDGNNREPLPKDWDWAANSLRMAFPPPLLRGNATGPPTPITTIGEARKARRAKFLEERAREEVRKVKPIQDKQMEPIKGEVNVVAKVIPSKTPIEKGKGKGVPQSKAPPPIVLQEATTAKPQVKYIDEYFVKKGENPFLLAEAIPESPLEEPSSASESWRGSRRPRPKESTATQKTKWEGTSNWSSWRKREG